MNDFQYQGVTSKLAYQNEKFDWTLDFRIDNESGISGNGSIPMNLALDNTGEVVYLDQPIFAELVSDSLTLDILTASGENIQDISGSLLLAVEAAGTINAPKLEAQLAIKDGAFNYETLGMVYQNIQVDTRVTENAFKIEKFRLDRDEGYMDISGGIEFDSSMASGIITASELQLSADNFWIARNRDFEIKINSDLSLDGSTESPVYGGTLAVTRSRFYLPAFIEGMAAVPLDPEKPLLLTALEEAAPKVVVDTSAADSTSAPQAGVDPIDYYSNLTGSMNLSIPRNTWLRSPEMSMEIAGDLEVVKNGLDFELFGSLEIVRGFYELLGRKFNILEGNLTFTGGTDYNPEVVLSTEYVFRAADKTKRTLTLQIAGEALTPQISFTLDDAAIEEADAIAYIMFGKSIDELGQVGSGESGTSEDLAKGAATSMVASQLAQTLGSKFNLDMLQIKGDDNWESASFVVGKYITTDLFMSYERGFGDATDTDIPPETITLEYELMRNLFLQMIRGDVTESGFDVIWKFQW